MAHTAPEQPDWETLRGLMEAIEAHERATVALLQTVRALKAKRWFSAWCEQHGIACQQTTPTAQLATDIRAVLARRRP